MLMRNKSTVDKAVDTVAGWLGADQSHTARNVGIAAATVAALVVGSSIVIDSVRDGGEA